ncbi:hypothetical protein D3C72_1512150 [compost metagenome]
MGRRQAVRRTFIDDQLGVLDELGRSLAGSVDRHDLVVAAVHDQGRHGDFLQVGREVRLGKLLDAIVGVLDAALHALQPEGVAHALRHFVAGTVGAEEGHGQVLEELRTVGQHAGADAVKHRHRQAARIRVRLDHLRRHGAHQHGLGHAFFAMAADIARHFAAARRMADQGRALDVERVEQGGQVVGVGIHVIALPWLARQAVAAAVMRDHAVAVAGQEHHLRIPAVRVQWPAVAEGHHGAVLWAPILVVELYPVGGSNGAGGAGRADRGHMRRLGCLG